MAAEDAFTAALEGSWPSPPVKHITINFWYYPEKKESATVKYAEDITF